MRSKKRFVIPVVVAALVVVGCSSDSDDDNGGSTTEGTTTEGTTTEGTTSDGTTTSGASAASFFNDDRGVDFANGLGSSVSQIFSSAFSAAPLLLGSGSFDGGGDAPTSNSGVDECLTSGVVTYEVVTNNATDNPESASIIFDDCNDEGELSTGAMLITFTGDFNTGNGSVVIVFEDFTVSSAGQVTNIDGGVGMSISTVGDTTTATVQGSSLSMSTTGVANADNFRMGSTGVVDEVSANSSVSFDDFNLTTSTNDTTGDSTVGGQADITTPEGSLQLSINPPLQVIGDADFPANGVVSMTASDGSSIEIDADSGNPTTYNYTINNQGAISSGTANWADSGIEGLDIEF